MLDILGGTILKLSKNAEAAIKALDGLPWDANYGKRKDARKNSFSKCRLARSPEVSPQRPCRLISTYSFRIPNYS